MADYVFIEYGTNVVRYEVRCRKCGERYAEDTGPSAPSELVLAEPSLAWPPDLEPVPPRDWRAELRGHLSVAAQRGRTAAQLSRAGLGEAGRRAHGWGEHTLTWVRERRQALAWSERTPTLMLEARPGQRELQTGG